MHWRERTARWARSWSPRLPVYPACASRSRSAGSPRRSPRACGARRREGWARDDDWAPGVTDRAAADARLLAQRRSGDGERPSPRRPPGAAWTSRDRAAVRRTRRWTTSASVPRPTSCARRSAATPCVTWSTATSTTPTSATTAASSAPSPRARRTRRCAARRTISHGGDRSPRTKKRGIAVPPKCACKAASIPTTPARPIWASAARSRRRCPGCTCTRSRRWR